MTRQVRDAAPDEPQRGLETRQMLAALERNLFDRESDPIQIGRFVVTGRLGSGAMGAVFSADDPDLNRRVAVKVLRGRPASSEGQDAATARMLREAKTMARLNHPNVITVHEVGMFEGNVFVAMEYVDAGTLEDWMGRCPVGSPQRLKNALDLATQAARGLAAAHEAGVIHRDLKPANMLLDRAGRIRIADFGLASSARASRAPSTTVTDSTHEPAAAPYEPGSQPQDADETAEDLTATGEVVGTPAYMAPEQMKGEATPLSDQFSYCASFFEAVYGVAPFEGKTLAARLDAIECGAVVQPPPVKAPAWLWSLLVRGLAAKPKDRHRDLTTLLAELEAHQSPPSRALTYAALGGVVVAGAATAYVVGRGDPCDAGESQLGAAWSEARKTEVADALRGSGLPYAQPTSDRVGEVIDSYAARWAESYDDACSATWDSGEQSQQMLDLRMLCLDRGRAALDLVTSTIASGDEDALRKSVRLAEGLPDLVVCSDREALRRRAEGRTPAMSDAAQRATLAMDEARVRLDIGRFDEAEELYAQARSDVADLELPEIVSRVESNLAQLRLQQGRFDDASAQADEALRAAAAGDDGDATALAHLQRARIDLKQRSAEDAQFQLDLAAASLLRGDSPRVRQAELGLVRGELATMLGDVGSAIANLDRAAKLFEGISGPGAVALSDVHHTKALALANSGRQDEALSLYLAAADVIANAYGEAHPGQAVALSGAAHVHSLRGSSQEALQLRLRAHALLEADPGYKPQQRARICLFIADDHARLANFEEAMAWLDRAEGLFIEVFGPHHPDTGLVDFSRAQIKLDQMGDFVGAAEAWRAVIERWEGVASKEHDSAIARLNLAISESRADQHERAVSSARSAREALSKFVDPDGQQMIGYLSSFGDIYRIAGDRPAAKEAYTRAVEISDAHGGGGFLIDEARFGLAQVLLDDGDRAGAARLAAKARANFANGGPAKQGVLNDLDDWVGQHFPDGLPPPPA